MKLYATVTSERASKGQGGNDYLEIELKAFDRETPIGIIVLSTMEDVNDDTKQYLLTWKDAHMENPMILREGHETQGVIQYAEKQDREETKGEQQKGETYEESITSI